LQFLEPKKRIRQSVEGQTGPKETILMAEVVEGSRKLAKYFTTIKCFAGMEPINFKWISPNRVEMDEQNPKSYRIGTFTV
jgi:hypothetical protein